MDTIAQLLAQLPLILIKVKIRYLHGGLAMVRVSFLIVLSTIFLSACASDPQQGSESFPHEVMDCIPNPTLVDVLSCASKTRGSGTMPAFETKILDERAS